MLPMKRKSCSQPSVGICEQGRRVSSQPAHDENRKASAQSYGEKGRTALKLAAGYAPAVSWGKV